MTMLRKFLAVVVATTGLVASGVAHAGPSKAEIQGLVPKRLAEQGTIAVAELSDFVPFSYVKDDQVVGAWVELSSAIVDVLGLKIDAKPTTFDVMLTGLNARRFDVAYGGFYVTPKRLEAADYISDFRDRDSFVSMSADQKVAGATDVCGKTVAVMAGSSHLVGIEKFSEECKGGGQTEVNILTFPSMYNAVLAVTSGRADLAVANLGNVGPLMSSNKKLQPVGDFTSGLAAAAFRKDEEARQLQEAWKAAINYLIETGEYQTILAKWGVEYGAVKHAYGYQKIEDLKGLERADVTD